MIGIYMSGTGNTKHCVGKLLSVIDPKAEMIPIESEESADKDEAEMADLLSNGDVTITISRE